MQKTKLVPSRPLPMAPGDANRLPVPPHKRINAKVKPQATMKPGPPPQKNVLGD